MSEVEFASSGAGGAGGGEVPVNPYSLLEAVNSASGSARGGWVLFLALMTYVLIAVAGVSHTDLLMNSKVTLPMLQVQIELTRFFMFAPLVLLFVHFGLLVQHVMLARKSLEFDSALRPMEATRKRTHPLRLELHSYFFTQALAGPHRGWLLGGFLHAMIWLTLFALPVTIMLVTQLVFLPYHDIFITWTHRAVLVADTLILLSMGVFLRRPEASFFGAFWRTARHHPFHSLLTSTMLSAILLFSFFVATVPGEALDRMASSLPGYQVTTKASVGGSARTIFSLTAFFFESSGDPDAGRLRGLFDRNLKVTDADLVKDSEVKSGEISLNLRNRDLRYANLGRSDLHSADLTGANLENATIVGTDLRFARLSCADINAVLTLAKSRERSCTHLNGADFTRAQLSGANLQLAYLGGAVFENAHLDGADLRYAELQGADFSGADMRGADLSGGTDLMGANFLGTLLQGADLSGANLQGADFSSAALQGALFSLAQAQGASFQGAEMNGANLNFARLQGADFDGAILKGTDFSSAILWLTVPPASGDTELSNMSRLKLAPIRERNLAKLKEATAAIKDPKVRVRVAAALKGLMDKAASEQWGTSADAQKWESLGEENGVPDPIAYAERLTQMLIEMSCQVRWSDGYVATGIIQRALMPGFKGDLKALYERLSAKECPASAAIDKDLFKRLSAEIERLESAGGESQ